MLFYRYTRVLKKEGKADTSHRKPIQESVEDSIKVFLVYLHTLMTPQETYDLSKIPDGYLDKIHYLAQWGMHYIITTYLARRANEGYSTITKAHFEKFTAEDGRVYYTKVKGELTKNHR